jgi:phage repressor protein C with HTH and peptisase S24 domain
MAPLYELRVAADVTRAILHDPAGEQAIDLVPYPVEAMMNRAHAVVAFRVSGNCLAPAIQDGHIAFVEISRDGWPIADLPDMLGRIVFAAVDDHLHIKVLEQTRGRYQLAPLDGEPPLPVDESVRIIGVVIAAAYEPRLPRRPAPRQSGGPAGDEETSQPPQP